MQLNLPIIKQLQDAQRILIAGVGGGFDIYAGLPVYFTLREMGKTVHLANYSFFEPALAAELSEAEVLLPDDLVGVRGEVRMRLPYYPEGYLAEWFATQQNEPVTVWIMRKVGVAPLYHIYRRLIEHVGGVDAILLVDGGVDSLMRGDEQGAGTLLEDTISLVAVDMLEAVPVKLLACIGFGTEVEEAVSHHSALENMAELTKAGAFYGSCAMTRHMPVFDLYEAACRYIWEQPKHQKSHISTRIIPAVHGEFGNFHLYERDYRTRLYISLLMTLYWFFDVGPVVERSLIAGTLRDTTTFQDALSRVIHLRNTIGLNRTRDSIPY